MSKKKHSPWRKITPAAQMSSFATSTPESVGQTFSSARDLQVAPMSPAQLAANRSNALLSTGPRSDAGKATSSKNAVKSALTGRTVLLPTDDVEEYAVFLKGFQNDLKPVGQLESELVQIIVDCYWCLRRIQELEYALYAHGERQFQEMLADEPAANRSSMIVLQTHLTYQKELRNLHIQEARIDRKRAKALAELQALQNERKAAAEHAPNTQPAAQPVPPPSLHENGFVFSGADSLEPRAPETVKELTAKPDTASPVAA